VAIVYNKTYYFGDVHQIAFFKDNVLETGCVLIIMPRKIYRINTKYIEIIYRYADPL
jgi:hypothetical protein